LDVQYYMSTLFSVSILSGFTGICIPGFEICVGSMRKGEMSKYLIKPEYAYGKHGCPPRIPGNATILMEIELVSFIDDAITEEFHRWTKEEQKRASFDEILAVVNGERKILTLNPGERPKTATKQEIVWKKLNERPDMLKKSFTVTGLANNLDGSEDVIYRFDEAQLFYS
ncbi:inactive peptidyl-prolyl cis-trans isomerase FKBP6-like, partial [Saccoglossus kowalevskii]